MVIAVDFDGTIVEHEYPKIGEEIPFATETLRMLINDHHKLIHLSYKIVFVKAITITLF